MRVYAPTTFAGLARLVADGVLGPTSERFVAVDTSEEAEYDALEAAGQDAALLLAGLGRRAVVVAEVDDVDGPITLADVVAVHADGEPVDPGTDPLPELGWFATQEIDDLLAEAGR